MRERLPFWMFIYVMTIIYIALGYYAEGLVKRIAKNKQEVKEKRAAYISLKSQLMQLSKQTRLAKALKDHYTGISESRTPPKKIKALD